jgi:hypothetical protein
VRVDSATVAAVSMQCTHSNCTIGNYGARTLKRYVCGCHHSAFSATGAVLASPATRPLKIYATTFDGSKAVLTIPELPTSGVEDDAVVPEATFLAQNFPNPFNPSTSIRFGIAAGTRVQIHLYSMVGTRVATIVDAAMPAGSHSVLFDAADLPSGEYLLQLHADGATLTRRMILSR